MPAQAEEAAQAKLSKCLGIPGTPQVQVERAQLSLEAAVSARRAAECQSDAVSQSQQATQTTATMCQQLGAMDKQQQSLLEHVEAVHHAALSTMQAHACRAYSAATSLQLRLTELMAANERVRDLADAQATANGAKQSLDIMLASKDEALRKQAQDLADARLALHSLSRRNEEISGDLRASQQSDKAARAHIDELRELLAQAENNAVVRSVVSPWHVAGHSDTGIQRFEAALYVVSSMLYYFSGSAQGSCIEL